MSDPTLEPAEKPLAESAGANQTNYNPLPLGPGVPIVLGVVGHRHLSADPSSRKSLEDAVESVLRDFTKRYPNSPLVILSSLAQGADQLVAEVAFKMNRKMKTELIVRAPLPFPQEVYAESSSFDDSDEGCSARNQMLAWTSANCEKPEIESFVTPLPDGPAADDIAAWRKICEDPTATPRHKCYANAGGYIVRHCHVLLALWNGLSSGKPSGTDELVTFKLTGQRPALYPWRESVGYRGELGPVIVVHSPRHDSGDQEHVGAVSIRVPSQVITTSPGLPPEGDGKRPLPGLGIPIDLIRRQESTVLALRRRAREGLGSSPSHHTDDDRATQEWFQFRATCRAIEDYNRDVNTHSHAIEDRVKDALQSSLGDDAALLNRSPYLERLTKVREAAASLSSTLDSQLLWSQAALFGLIFLAVLFFHLYAHLFQVVNGHTHHQPLWLGLFLGCLFLAGVLVFWVWLVRLDARRLDYRALAETLRVRCWWAMAGIGRSAADSYLSQLRTEMAWARRALQCLSPPPSTWKEEFHQRSDAEKLQCLQIVRKRWVEGQRKFFADRRHKHHGRAMGCRFNGAGIAAIGWLIGAPLLMSVGHLDAHEPTNMLLISIGMFIAGGGLLIAYGERQSHEELAKQYDRMAAVFGDGLIELNRHLPPDDARASAAWTGVLDIKAAQEVLEHLGREAIAEHAQWLILRRARPFEMLIH